jgi:hypothetical protein
MELKEPVRIVLELEPGQETITGLLRGDGCREERFWGWLELLAILETARQPVGAAVEEGLREET